MSTVIAGGLVFVTGLLALLVVGLLRSHAEIIRALHDLGVNLDPDTQGGSTRFVVTPPTAAARADGSAVHDITGERPGGGSVVVAVTGTRHRTLLAFLTSTCTTCRDFWDAFGDAETTIPGRARLVVVVRDTDAESPSALSRLVAPYFVTVHSTAAWQQYGVPGAPYFVLVDGAAERVIGEGTAPTWRHARGLLEQALGDAMQRPDGDREAVVDAALRDAGIEPGDPSLYPGDRPMTELSGGGVSVELPAGWEGSIQRRPELVVDQVTGQVVAAAVAETVVVQLATFALPPSAGDFGGGAVETMMPRDVLVVLFEYGDGAAARALFAPQGVPRFRPEDASPATLRLLIEGQSGIQRFFHVGDRAFCLYVVLGSHRRRVGQIGLVNDLLAELAIE